MERHDDRAECEQSSSKPHNSSSCGLELNDNVFNILGVDIDQDLMSLSELSDILTGEAPYLYPATNPVICKPYVITPDDMDERIALLEKYMILNLPDIFTSTDKEILNDESTFLKCDKSIQQAMNHIVKQMMQEENIVTDNVLRKALNYYRQLLHVLGNPAARHPAYEDLFLSFCTLADVELLKGSNTTRHLNILGAEVSVEPDFLIATKKVTRERGKHSKTSNVVAVVKVKKGAQWEDSFTFRPYTRPSGYKLTASMRSDLLAEMVAHLDASRCRGSTSAPDGLPLCVVGVSVFMTKICFCFLEFPVKQYNDLISIQSLGSAEAAAYQRKYSGEKSRKPSSCQQATPERHFRDRAVLRYTECYDMTRKEDRSHVLTMLYSLGNIVEVMQG